VGAIPTESCLSADPVERAEHGGKWIFNSDAGDHPEKHHRRQTTGGNQKYKTTKMSNNDSEAACNLQHSCEPAETGETVAFELRHHAFR
jgi:hypothetical protein